MRTVFAIALILFAFAGFGVSAQEKGANSVVAPERRVTLEAFTEALPKQNEKELGLAGLQKLQAEGPLVIIDVRSKEAFDRRHLKGSVNMPLTELTEKTLPQIAPDKTVPVAVACDYTFYPVRMLAMTLQAYPVLKANGYEKVHRLNLWSNDGTMTTPEEQEKILAFEGTEVKPQ